MKYILILLFFCMTLEAKGFPKSYYEITNPKLRKAKFVEIILPMIQDENRRIMAERKFIINFFSKDFLINFNFRMTEQNISLLTQIAQKYDIEDIYDKEAYLSRIDKIPPSLAIAQGALESAWGSSRFVKLGNNIFGQWTWSQDNGIVPQARAEGKKHMIRNFDTLQESVTSYMLNLNKSSAYTEFRTKRKIIKNFNGVDASKTMINYSQLGDTYVDRLILMINNNDLLKLDYTPLD